MLRPLLCVHVNPAQFALEVGLRRKRAEAGPLAASLTQWPWLRAEACAILMRCSCGALVQLLKMGRVNAAVMPVVAVVVCVLLIGIHLKDPTQDGQVCTALEHAPLPLHVAMRAERSPLLQLLDSMEEAAEKMDRTQKLRVLKESGVLETVTTRRAVAAAAGAATTRAGMPAAGVGRRPAARGAGKGHAQGRQRGAAEQDAPRALGLKAVQRVQGLLELQQLSLSDEISINVPASGKRGTVKDIWTDEGWVKKRVAPVWVASAPHGTNAVGQHGSLNDVGGQQGSSHDVAARSRQRESRLGELEDSLQARSASPAQQAWDNWVNTALLGQTLDATISGSRASASSSSSISSSSSNSGSSSRAGGRGATANATANTKAKAQATATKHATKQGAKGNTVGPPAHARSTSAPPAHAHTSFAAHGNAGALKPAGTAARRVSKATVTAATKNIVSSSRVARVGAQHTRSGSSGSDARPRLTKKSAAAGRTAKLAMDTSSQGTGEGGSVGESASAPQAVNSFAGRYSDDVPGVCGVCVCGVCVHVFI
jgi:hypothetical protein